MFRRAQYLERKGRMMNVRRGVPANDKTGSYNNVKFVNVSLSSIMRNIRERKPIVSSTILLFVPRIDGE